jgi:pimeloyl-ACP methyl ester carboxylesterase
MRRRVVAPSKSLPRFAVVTLTGAMMATASFGDGHVQENLKNNTQAPLVIGKRGWFFSADAIDGGRPVGHMYVELDNLKERAEEPLVIAKQGWFFTGGTVDAGRPVGHMYVEFQIPYRLASPYPVVMIHGGNQTGTNFTGTPDGRDGWAQYFLRRGYAVYVVDQVARGRAAQWSQSNGAVTTADLTEFKRRFVAPERFNLWPQAHLHTQWPGGDEPGDPIFDQFYASQFPSLIDFRLQQSLNRDAVITLLDNIGPAVLLVHSQSGAFAWPIADKRRDLVKAIIAVEPSGPPVHDVDFKGMPAWFADNPYLKPYGLVAVPLTYDPPVTAASPIAFVREDKPERPEYVRCWMQSEPAHELVNLQNTPILIVTAEASYHASYDHCTARYLAQAGVKTTFVRLEDVGIHGNGHMMMLEKNSDAIAEKIAEWLNHALVGEAR